MLSSKTLHYGDYIILSSSGKGSPKYYSARNSEEAEIKVISERKDKIPGISGLSLTLYPNFNELIFRIYPKLTYDTFKELQNLKKTDHRYELLNRRLDADEKLNANMIRTSSGKPCKYGDSIQLYHDLSDSFLSVSSEKVKGRNMFKLKLALDGSESVHFKLQPGISLKKDGQSVGYKDKILLFNQLTSSYLLFPNKVSPFRSQTHAKTIQMSRQRKTSQKIDPSQLPKISDLPLSIENSIFLKDNAYSNFDQKTQFGRKDNLVDESGNFSRMMVFKKVEFWRQKERKDLRYGDFIQIRSFGNTGQQSGSNQQNQQGGTGGAGDIKRVGKVGEGWLVCESNFSGFKPGVKYRRVKNNDFRNLLAYDSIFEMVPPNISMWGQKIDFLGKNYANVSFRHFLTGNLLTYQNLNDLGESTFRDRGLETDE